VGLDGIAEGVKDGRIVGLYESNLEGRMVGALLGYLVGLLLVVCVGLLLVASDKGIINRYMNKVSSTIHGSIKFAMDQSKRMSRKFFCKLS